MGAGMRRMKVKERINGRPDYKILQEHLKEKMRDAGNDTWNEKER